MPKSVNPHSREVEIRPPNTTESYTTLTNPSFFGRIHRKFSISSSNSSKCSHSSIINSRRSKKLRADEENESEEEKEQEEEVELGSQEILQSSRGHTISESEVGRKRKVTHGAISSRHGVVETRRIDKMFQVLRKGRNLDAQNVIHPVKRNFIPERSTIVREKENDEVHVNRNLRCLETVRMLMEQQSLSDCKAVRGLKPRKVRGNQVNKKGEEDEEEEKEPKRNIPHGTRLAFAIYNGTWPLEFSDIKGQIHLNPLFEYNDTDQGEFHLFYKRIFHYILIQDAKLTLQYEPTFLSRSKLSVQLRARLFNWMIKVQQYLHMRTESLHLAASFVDQFTWHRSITETSYQLVGITALFLAGKVNERVPASLCVLCYLTEHSYSQEQVLDMEQCMLQTLEFEVNTPIPHHFLGNALISCDDLSQETRDLLGLLCLYLFELGLTEVELCKCSASLRCAAAVFLSRKLLIFNKEDNEDSALESSMTLDVCPSVIPPPNWTSRLTKMLGHGAEKEMKQVALIYASTLVKVRYHFTSDESGTSKSHTSISEAAFLKFSNQHYAKIARLSILNTFCYSELLSAWDMDK